MTLVKKNITLRPATDKDCEMLFIWRNDSTAYQFYLTPQPVSREEHERWFRESLVDPCRKIFIIERNDGIALGQIRFDIEDDEASITISINREHRGHGYGTQAIISGSSRIVFLFPKIRRIIAQVKENNSSSLYAFQKAHFEEYKRDKGIIWLRYASN